MSSKFDTFFDRLIGHEGGYVNDPKDPGGETNWGISKRSYPTLDIRALTREHAKQIYKRDFWDRLNGDAIEDGVAFQLFDFAVNSGISRALLTYKKVSSKASTESDLILLILAERLEFMTTLKNWPAHGRGWARRIAANLRYGALDS